jgi:tRNA pseudouridine55 synthase
LDGFLLVDKPCGPSSFAVVKRARLKLGCDKAGHAGTLDPLASGLVIVALGAATRLLSYLPEEPKRYRFGIRFGTQTDTLDTEGIVTAEGGRVPAREEILAALPAFIGKIPQVPPKYSAVKVRGKRAYARARDNEEFDIAEKTVTVFSLELVNFDQAQGIAECEAACSRGTYVRALVRDIAAEGLGTLAHASFIRRLSIGPFTVGTALAFDSLSLQSGQAVIPVRTALSSVPSATLSREQCAILAHGKDIGLAATADTVIGYTEKGDVAAVLTKKEDGVYHPEKVFVKG